MRLSVGGLVRIGSTVVVYDPGTLNPSTIYAASSGGAALAGGVVIPDASGFALFYYDDADYPFPSFFDIVESLSGYADVSRSDVGNFFTTVSGVITPGTVPSSTPYTLANMRARLAIFCGSLDETDTQIKDMLNECIQTGYEKVVSTVNTHARQSELTANSVANIKEYDISNLGIPTYVGYKSKRLVYLPYEVLREKYNNFGTDWDSGTDEPVHYSLVGFDGLKKTLIVAPAPKVTGEPIYVLCFQNPGVLSADTDYPLVPAEWQWLILERGKIERTRFLKDIESYQIQAQEFVAYIKVMIKRIYPAAPEPEAGFVLPPERVAYNAWRSKRT